MVGMARVVWKISIIRSEIGILWKRYMCCVNFISHWKMFMSNCLPSVVTQRKMIPIGPSSGVSADQEVDVPEV